MNSAPDIDEALESFVERLRSIISPADLRKFKVPHAKNPEFYDTYLESIGPDFFLNTIAAGQLPAEIALEINVPILHLNDWMFKTVDADKINLARKACAESMMVKSATVLLLDQETSQQVALVKEWSKRLMYMAERLDSEAWGPPVKDENNAPSTVHISIQTHQQQETADEMRRLQDLSNHNGGRLRLEDVLNLEVMDSRAHDQVQTNANG